MGIAITMLTVLCGIACFVHLISRIMNWGNCRPATKLNWAIYALTVPVLTAPLYYEFTGLVNTPVTFEGNHAVVRPLGAFVWEYGDKFANIPTSLPIRIYGYARPITSNPKVRELSYELQVTISDLDRFFVDPKNRNLRLSFQEKIYGTSFSQFPPGYTPQNVPDKIGVTTLDLLYRFNDAHSKELAEFYNPLDPEQLRALKGLVEPWFNERLAPHGLRAELQGFTVK